MTVGVTMTTPQGAIPDLTIETLSRSFFKESVNYGFTQMDYVRFVNRLLDLSMNQTGDGTSGQEDSAAVDVAAPREPATLPLMGPNIRVRGFAEADDLMRLEQWIAEAGGRYFLLSRTTSRAMSVADLVHSDGSVLGVITLPDGKTRPSGAWRFSITTLTSERPNFASSSAIRRSVAKGTGKKHRHCGSGMDSRRLASRRSISTPLKPTSTTFT